MKIQLLEAAKVELDEAIDYYNHEAPGLGEEFLIEILNVFGRIDKYPEAWHPLSQDVPEDAARGASPMVSYTKFAVTKF